MTELADFTAALAPIGLNALGVASPGAWDGVVPEARRSETLFAGTRAILVVGNGGRSLWDAFLADLEASPAHLVDEPNPLDAFVRRAVLQADSAWRTVPRRWFWAAADAEVHIDFRVLAHLAGLGQPGRLGLLMHPTFGPWMGLRAACFLGVDLPFSPPSPLDWCDGCPAPCVSACPGGAFPTGQWAVDRCSAFKLASPRCTGTCHSRTACPVASEHRYPEDQLRYHSDRATGRAALRDRLGIPASADPFPGSGPYWGDWRARVDVGGSRGP